MRLIHFRLYIKSGRLLLLDERGIRVEKSVLIPTGYICYYFRSKLAHKLVIAENTLTSCNTDTRLSKYWAHNFWACAEPRVRVSTRRIRELCLQRNSPSPTRKLQYCSRSKLRWCGGTTKLSISSKTSDALIALKWDASHRAHQSNKVRRR